MRLTAALDAPSSPQPRPRLADWLAARGLLIKDAAGPLGVTPQAVGRYLRPFGDPLRQIPGEEVMARVHAFTAGEITPADFYPPHLRPVPMETAP